MRKLAALVFPGFQTLDLFGPLEILGDHTVGEIDIKIVSETRDPVASYHGFRTVVDRTFADGTGYDCYAVMFAERSREMNCLSHTRFALFGKSA